MLFRKSQRVKNKPGGKKFFRAAEFIFRATFFGERSQPLLSVNNVQTTVIVLMKMKAFFHSSL